MLLLSGFVAGIEAGMFYFIGHIVDMLNTSPKDLSALIALYGTELFYHGCHHNLYKNVIHLVIIANSEFNHHTGFQYDGTLANIYLHNSTKFEFL